MKIFSQAKLLLWKNIILRYRHPGVLILEVIWPILIIGIVAIMRLAVPPLKYGNCHYQPRAMPSAGAIPFLQTYLCNLDNPCYNSEQKLRSALTTTQEFSAMTQALGPKLASDEVLDVLAVSNKTAQVYTMIKKAVGNKEMLHGLENIMNISTYFRNSASVKEILVNKYKLMSNDEVDALLKSRINVGQLVNLTGSPDFKAIACDHEKLSSYVDFPKDTDVRLVSKSLCNITEDETSGLANLMIGQLNFTTIFNSIKLMEEVKETFKSDHFPLSYAFEIVAQMFETITESNQIVKLLGGFAGIPDVASFLRDIPNFFPVFDDLNSFFDIFKGATTSLEPVMQSAHLDNSSIWLTVINVGKLSENFVELVEGKWNGTSKEFIEPMNKLIKNIEKMTEEEDGKQFMAVFEFISKIDWVKLYDEFIFTQSLSKQSIEHLLTSMQTMFEEMSEWQPITKVVRLIHHTLDVLSIITEKSIELRRAVVKLFDSNDGMKKEINRIFAYGPTVTNTILEAFLKTDLFMDMANGASYVSVCQKALMNLRTQVPPDVYNDVTKTLCTNEDDVNNGLAHVFEMLKLDEVATVINKTIEEFAMLYRGEFFHDNVQLVNMYSHYIRFTNALGNYLYGDYKWIDVFKAFSLEDIDLNEKDWEPITDMLNENTLTTIMLGSFQSIVKVFVNSPIADDLSPMIHVISEMTKMVYEMLTDINNILSVDSSIMKVTKIVTKNLPELIDGLSNMMMENNMTAISHLLTSKDPLDTFCTEKYIYKMRMPPYIPVDEMNDLVCNTDWETVFANITRSTNHLETIVTKMIELMKMEPNTRYNIEADWIQLEDYSERIFDMITRGQIFGVIDMRTTTVAFFDQIDLSRMGEAMESLSRLIEKMGTKSPFLFVEMGFKVMTAMDTDQSMNEMLNSVMTIVDIIMDMQLDSLKMQKNITSLMGIMEALPPKMRTMTMLFAKAYPQLVSAAANMMNNPQKLTNQIIATGVKAPDCKTLYVSDLLMLPQDSSSHNFEKFLCALNWTEFIIEVMRYQGAPFEKIGAILTGPSNNKEVDLERLAAKFDEYNRLIINPMVYPDVFDMTPYNFTAIDMAWEKFNNALNNLQSLDMQKIQEVIGDIQLIATTGAINMNETGLLSLMYSSLYINNQVTKLMLHELSHFNASEVYLFDFLGSQELDKLKDFLVTSPDINAVGVATLSRLISDPLKAPKSLDFQSFCSNATIFSQVFVVDVSPKDPAELQKVICEALSTLNISLVFEQIMDRLEPAIRALSESDLDVMKKGSEDVIINTQKLSDLIAYITMHPPTVKIISKDDLWMNPEVYAKEWEKLGQQLNNMMGVQGNASSVIERVISIVIVEVVKALPRSSEVMGYIDAILDIMQLQVEDDAGDVLQRFKAYPNTGIVVDLLNNVTDVIQTVVYTALTQQHKIAAWSTALQSWEGFCQTPTTTIFSVPKDLQFNMNDYKNDMCSIDGDELLKELAQIQMNNMMPDFSNVTSNHANTTELEKKLFHLIQSFSKQITSPQDMTAIYTMRLYDGKVWEAMFERVGSWLSDSDLLSSLMSQEQIINAAVMSLQQSLQGMPEVMEMVNKAFAVTDVVVDELLKILNSKTLDEAFKEVPSMKPFIYLLNSVPELIETVLYTGTFHPEKISLKLMEVQSFESFCMNRPEALLSQAPNSTFDVKQWMDTLCSINETVLEQFMQYKVANQIYNIIENSLNKPVNVSDIIAKTEKLVNRLTQGLEVNERVFDPDVWNNVMIRLNIWMQGFDSPEQIFADIRRSFSVGVFQYLQSAPYNIHYVDAILDIAGQRLENSKDDLKEIFKGFPSIETFMQLLEVAPEMIDTVLYTVFTQSQKTSAWPSAMSSWSSFCSTPASDIMTVPPGNRFNVSEYLTKMCTIDIDQLVTELNTYEGYERLKQIDMGNDTVVVDITQVMKKMDDFFTSLQGYVTNPMDTATPNLRLFNASIWEGIGSRVEKWLDMSLSMGLNKTIAEIINQVYTTTLSKIPEAQDVFIKMLRMTDVLTSQMMDVIKTGSISSTFGNSTNVQMLTELSNNIPEIYEILIYTSIKDQQKLSSASNSFMSFDALCATSPEDLFSVPTGLNFDLKRWFSLLCSLNLTAINEEITNTKAAQDLETIISGSASSNLDITSIIKKVDELINQFGKDMKFNDRLLNESVWSQVMSSVEKWMSDPSVFSTDPMMYVSQIFDTMEQLQRDPHMKEILRPVSVVMAVVDNLMDNLLEMKDKTELTGHDLFEGWKNMEKTLSFVQIPQVLDVLFASSNTPKFMSLFSEDGLKDFCEDSTDPQKYLTSPADKSVDLQKIKSGLCDIDFNNYLDGFESFFNTKTIEKISTGSSDFDWKSFQSRVEDFIDLVTKWEKQPPKLNLPPHWLNETYWQNLMDRDLTTLPEKLATKDQIKAILTQMGPLLDTEGFKQFGMVLNSVMDILNLNIRSMTGADYTLSSLIESIPALRNVLEAVGVNSDTLRSIALSPIKNTTLFVQLFLSEDVQNDFCNTDKWRKAIDFPVDFDSSGLFKSVCQNDVQSLLDKLMDNFNLRDTLNSLMDNSSHVQDWKEATEKIFTLIDDFKLLIENPPSLDSDKTLSILSENYNTSNLFKLAGALSTISAIFPMSNEMAMPNNTMSASLEIEGIVNVVVGILDKVMARVRVKNGRLDIAALFEDVPEVQRVIKGILDVQPDPLTGLFAVALRADKINDFMSWANSPSKLKELFCTKPTFERIFQIREDIKVDELLNALCALDFDNIAEKLEDSFLPDMSGNDKIDVEKLSKTIEDVIAQLTNMTMIDTVMFNGIDLGTLFMINSSRLMEELDFLNVGEAVSDEYVTITTQILNTILNDMSNTSEVKTLANTFKFVVVYLESFNSFLRSIKDQPISLAVLLNNTEVGAILNPILTDPIALDDFMGVTVDIKKLSELLKRDNDGHVLCSSDIFAAVHTSSGKHWQTFQDFQTHICEARQSVMLWQTVMLQANGHILRKQLDYIENEMQKGKDSIDTTAIAKDMEELVSLMQSIIGQYVDGSRTFADLVDISEIKKVLEHLQNNLAQKLLNASKSWSVAVADIILPKVVDEASLQKMSKALNTMNMFMNLTIVQLEGMKDGSLDVSDFFLKADALQSLIDAYIRLGKNIAPAWSNNEFYPEKMDGLFKNISYVQMLCKQGGISEVVTGKLPLSQAVQDFSVVVCFVMGSTMTDKTKEAIGYNEIDEMLKSIWEDPKPSPQYAVFISNVESFTQLVQQLATKSYTISSTLLNSLNKKNTLASIENIAENPQVIFQILKVMGLGIEMPLGEDAEAVKSLSQMNSFVLMPMIQILEAMQAKGLSLMNVGESPNSVMNFLSVLVDFDVHFAVIKEFAVVPQINTLSRNKDSWCSSSQYWDMIQQRLATMSLSVKPSDILSMICSEDSSKWIKRFEEMGLTNVQMEVVLDKMMMQSDLFQMYDDQFKWIDLISSMEKLSNLISGSEIKSGSNMDDIQSVWNTTKDILFEKAFKSLFSYLEMTETSLPPDPDWLAFKQFLKFSSSLMKTINNNLDSFSDQQAPVQLKDILPDSERVTDLIVKMIGGQNAAELLTTFIAPLKYFELSMTDSWKDICSGKTNITEYFNFPKGTRIHALKSSLCEAATENKLVFEEFLSLFKAKDMFKQLDLLVNNQWNDSRQALSVYDETHTAMMNLIKNLENLQHIMVDGKSVDSYFQPIITNLNSLGQSTQIADICRGMELYLNQTEDYKYFHDMLAPIFTVMNLVSDLVKVVPDIDDLVCSLSDNSDLNLNNFMQKLNDLGFVRNIQKAIEDSIQPSTKLKCSTPLTFSAVLMEVIESTTAKNGLDIGRINVCMENTEVELRTMISSSTKLIEFMKNLVGVMQDPKIQDILNDPELLSTFTFIMNAIDANKEVMLKFEDLIGNQTEASAYFTNILGIPQSVANSIMNAVVHQDWKHFFAQSIEVIGDILCSPTRLSELITLPEGPGVNMTEISQMLCINDTAQFLKNISFSAEQINQKLQGANFMKTVIDITNGLADFVTNFNDIIKLYMDLASGLDIDVLKSNVKAIDEIVSGKVMTDFGNSLKTIFSGAKPFLSEDSSTQEVIKSIDEIIDGILAIDVVKGVVTDSLQVKDLVVDSDALNMYMTQQLSFSQDMTNSILDSIFSARVFFGLDDKATYTCDEVFKMILVMNGTGKKPEDISDAFCHLDEKQLEGLVNALKMELDIGSLVAKYVSYTTDSILSSTEMTKEELNDVVEKIDKSQVVIKETADIFKKTRNGSKILEVFSDASADAFTSMDRIAPLMCGEEVDEIFDTGVATGMLITSPEKITSQLQDGIKHNLDDLPNDFCVEIYEGIRSSEIGSILWAYVKPIMRGKILYTPDNEVTRKLIRKANDTFETLQEVNRISTIWATQANNLKGMTVPVNETDGLRDALDNEFIKGLLEGTVGVSATNVLSGLDALQSNNFDSNDLTALQQVAEIISNYTSCIEMDRFVPMETEEELEQEAYRLSQDQNFWAGIVFQNSEEPSTGRRKRQASGDIPKHVKYKIRMDVDNVMDTSRLKSRVWKMAAEDSFVEDLRYLRGFIYIQDIMDNAIIDFHKNPTRTTPGFKIRQMPFPCHHYDSFIFMLGSYLIPVMMTFVFLAALGTATHNLIYDRENGQEENLHVMGMMSGLNFFSWFISTMTLMTVVCAIISVMLKYTDIFIYTNTFILFLYLVTFCFSSVMLLYMVSAFFSRTTLAILFVLMIYLISYLPYTLVIAMEVNMEYWQKCLACLASTTAFSFGAHSLGYLEESGEGLQWNNIKSDAAKDFSIHWTCIMMLIDSAIYFVIGWYVRHVKPGKYGVPQSWYFPISLAYWCSCLKCSGSCTSTSKQRERSKGSLFEEAPPDHEVGIEVNGLSKAYGRKKVLHDLTIDFYEGQISCLLGHNGAAKTTALKMLYGVLDPSSGSVFINGMKPGSGRHSLGICPQQNALFEYMSVIEHMEFYAGIKGVPSNIRTMAEIKKLLKDVDLWHARRVPVSDLSYGMKRRLCVALAFVGGSRTVVLDEPTSGVDPHARKNIWNLISSNRPGRTIILSTHHLDEADNLGDRIAILHKGRLLCSGSPTFLKRQIGGGFKLMISKNDPIDKSGQNNTGAHSDSIGHDAKILNYVRSMCPGATIVEKMGTELVIDIAKDDDHMKVPLPMFFQELDQRSKDLGIANYGLTDTKVEDIFLQLTSQMDQADDKGTTNPAMSYESETSITLTEDLHSTTDTDQPNSFDTKRRNSGSSLVWAQMLALLIKRFHHYRRNWRMLLTCVLLPLMAFLIAMAFSKIQPDEDDMRPLVLDPVLYGKDTYTFLKQNVKDSENAKAVAETIRKSDIGIGTSCMADIETTHRLVKPTCRNNSNLYNINKPLYIIGCQDARQNYHEIKGQRMIVEEQTTPNDLYLQNLDDYNIPNYILRTFRDYKDERFGGWSMEKPFDEEDTNEFDPYVWFNSKGYHAMPSFFNGLSNSILRANLPFYENADEYGITTINHPIRLTQSPLTMETLENDAADAGISIMIVLAFSFLPCGFILYVINERNQKEKQLQQISGVGTFMYWAMTWLWDMFIYLIAVGISVGIMCIFKTDSFYIRDNLAAFAVLLILYGWAIIPYMYAISRMFNSPSTAYLVMFCLNLFLSLATIISLLVMQLFRDDEVIWECYKVCRYAFLIFPQFSLGQGLMDMVSSTVKYKLFLRFGEDFYEDPFSTDVIGWKLLALTVFGFFFWLVTLISEKIHAGSLSIPDNNSDSSSYLDDDVIREKERIQKGSHNDILKVDDLSKVYRRGWKKFAAVDHISFGVAEGESFGLLGVNGAGKTTTFRMLTGDLGNSGGKIMFQGKKISLHDSHFGQSVGYCPQEGGLDEYLTASEMLHFHARLRGFNKDQSVHLVDQHLFRLGLKPYANKAVHTYSGGTKKKLALAVAMLGDPPILYLDEPTTGMDAGTRRQAWKCIARANRNGQSVILTSHTMDECDALCSKIAIMVNGQIKCIGSPQYLKHKFGDGYTATVHSQKDNMSSISHFFLNQFPGAAIQNKHHSTLEVMIPQNCAHIADILRVLQNAQDEDMIEYYSLSQTTLDSVFVTFAQDQTDAFDEATVTNSSSYEGKFTPRSSVSSERPPAYDRSSHGKKESPYTFTNPQFIEEEDESDNTRPRYVSNITLAASTPQPSNVVALEDINTKF